MKNHRSTPVVEDLAGTQIKLARWLSELFQYDYQVEKITIPTATGMSNVTLIFTLKYQNSSNQEKERKCVARLQPQELNTVFPNYDLELQYRIMDVLGKKSRIPVPNLIGLEKNNEIEIDINEASQMPQFEIPGMPGANVGMINISEMLGKSMGGKSKKNVWFV